jgi:hypothetical protein
MPVNRAPSNTRNGLRGFLIERYPDALGVSKRVHFSGRQHLDEKNRNRFKAPNRQSLRRIRTSGCRTTLRSWQLKSHSSRCIWMWCGGLQVRCWVGYHLEEPNWRSSRRTVSKLLFERTAITTLQRDR